MKISTRGRYALRFMIDLARYDNGQYALLRDIAARQQISIKYLEQIATALGKAGLIESMRGPQGGYRLTRSPQEYTVGDILRPIEGNLACVACLETRPNPCPQYSACHTVRFWEGLQHVILDYLDGTTLATLAGQQENTPFPC